MKRRMKDRRLAPSEENAVARLNEFLDRRSGNDRRDPLAGGTYRAQHDPNFEHCTCDQCWQRADVVTRTIELIEA